MAEEPTIEELLDRIRHLESLVTTEPFIPDGPEYSFPTKRMGISQLQHQQMELANGDGVIISDGSEFPYQLTGYDSDAETNEQNAMILRVSRNTGKNEARLAGFYHRMDADMVIEYPSVTKKTTYYTCITYDPRKFEDKPLYIDTYDEEPPTESGMRHILLHTITREPNQLLTDAKHEHHRHYVSPTITVTNEARLPESTDVLYGTLGVVRSRTSSGTVVPGTGMIYEARGIHGWFPLLAGEWRNLKEMPHAAGMSYGVARWTHLGVQVCARINLDSSESSKTVFELPPGMGVTTNYRTTVWSTAASTNRRATSLTISAGEYSGRRARVGGQEGGWIEVNHLIPGYFFE